MSVFVIAEIGINHNGDINLAKKMIDNSVSAGADAVKFQKRDINVVYSKEFLESHRESLWGEKQRDQKFGLEFNEDQYKIIDEYCKNKKIEWFENSKINPYMSNVENIQKNKRDTIPAVTHIDGTGRVQTVSKNLNEDFYNLIFEFYKITDVPILLNTSFNENEPIVMSPDHAIRCFLKTNMDLLVLNNYLITR